MKQVLAIILTLLIIGCQDYEFVEEDRIYFKDEDNFTVLKYYKDKSDKSEFLMIRKDTHGNKIFEALVRDHKFYGKRKHFYPNGKLKQVDSFITECDISDCGSNVFSKEFSQNGNLTTEHYLKNCEHNGICRTYDTLTGKLISELNYREGKLTGRQIEFFENGRIKNLFFATNGAINGMGYYFDRNGDTLEISNFIDNERTLPYTEFRNDTILIGNYENSKMDFVVWTYYDKKRNIINIEKVKSTKGKVKIPN